MKKQFIIMFLMLVPMIASAQNIYQEYIKAAKKGDADAQFRIGSCYSNGVGVKKDEKKAVDWWRKAAEQGHAISQGLLGHSYQEGVGVTKNPSQAVYWYRKSAEQGNVAAQMSLALCYMGYTDIPKDNAQAFYWWTKAAEQGHAMAQYWEGKCYANGIGVARDDVKAFSWFSKAAEQGHAEAQLCVGYALYEGLGVSKDYSQAIYWLQKSVANGEAKANTYLTEAKKKLQEQEAESVIRKQIVDSVAKKYEAYEDPEWKSKAKIDQHYSTLLYESDFPYVSFENYDESTRFLVRCNKRTDIFNGHFPIKIKVQGGGRSNIADLNNCFVRFKNIRRGSISFTTNTKVDPQMTFETEDGTTLTFDCQTEADLMQLPYLFNVNDVETARIVLIGAKVWGTRDTRFPYAPLTIIGVGIGNSTKRQHEILVVDNQGQKHSIMANLSLTNALTLEDEVNLFIDHYKFSDPEKAFPKIPKSDWNLIRQGKIRIGMSKDACTLSWGEPDDINTSRGSWGVHEQWVYPRNKYVYFENGRLSAIQE